MNDKTQKSGPKWGKRKPVKGQPLTVKQEKFAQGLAAGKHFTEAFREAYDCSNMLENSVYVKAHHEQSHPKIAARVLELKAQIEKARDAKLSGKRLSRSNLPVVNEAARAQVKVVERVIMDRHKITELLLDDRELARKNGQCSAAVGALKVVSQLHGLISDNREAKGELSDIERMNVDELRNYIRGKLPGVGLNPEDIGLDFIDMRPASKRIN